MWGLAIVSLLLMGGTTALVLKALWLQCTGGPEGSLLPNALCSAGAGVAGLLLSGFAPDDMTSPLGFFAGMDLIVCMVALLFSLRTRR